MTWRLIFGYKHVKGVPLCPCADPGNYCLLEQDETDPLHLRFRCWCGSTMEARMDDVRELVELLALNGVTSGVTT